MNTRLSAGCHFIRLTPQGRGAVATLRVQGAQATQLVGLFFQIAANRQLDQVPVDEIMYGCWRSVDGAGSEDVVVCRRSTEAIEIHSHGGLAAQNAIMESLQQHGAEPMLWQDWVASQHASRIQASARVALSAAHTEKTACILLDQLYGALDQELAEIIEWIRANRADHALRRLDLLLAYARAGESLTRPWRVAVAGPPNVGKSSLINVILGFERSIVADQPGTTRDLLTSETALDGWPIHLIDTAGMREEAVGLEQAGILLAVEKTSGADLTLLVFDASQPWEPQYDGLRNQYAEAVIVYNKIDLIESADLAKRPDPDQPFISALRGDGIDSLLQLIVQRLVPVVPPRGVAVPFLGEHRDTIAGARQLLASGHLELAITELRNLAR